LDGGTGWHLLEDYICVFEEFVFFYYVEGGDFFLRAEDIGLEVFVVEGEDDGDKVFFCDANEFEGESACDEVDEGVMG